MSYDRYQTPTSKCPWIFFLVLCVAWLTMFYSFSANAAEQPPPVPSGPDYVTSLGISVYDPFHHSFAEQIDIWALMTVLKAPDEDRQDIFEVLDGSTLIIHKGPYIEDEVFPCGPLPEGMMLLGCTDPFDRVINIAWETCNQKYPSPGIYAHEIGHVIGYLGHIHPYWFGPNQDHMARLVSEPLCRMQK